MKLSTMKINTDEILNDKVYTRTLFDEPDFMWLFSLKVRFKYLEANQRLLFMGDLSNGSFFKLV